MKKPRIFWTWWTKPCKENRVAQMLMCYALSLGYAKAGGAHCVLYTDERGAQLTKGLPYDEVHVVFTEERMKSVHPMCFAASKFIAYESEPLGSIFIDGDVFLMRKNLIDIISADNADVVIQCREWMSSNECDYPRYNKVLSKHMGYYPQSAYVPFVFNCGLVKFNNQQLKDKYIRDYWRAHNNFKWHPECGEELNKKGIPVPDLIFEQQGLTVCTLDGEYTDSVVLLGSKRHEAYNYTYAKQIGYTHLLCTTKYKINNKIQKVLKDNAPSLYSIVLQNINDNNLTLNNIEYGQDCY